MNEKKKNAKNIFVNFLEEKQNKSEATEEAKDKDVEEEQTPESETIEKMKHKANEYQEKYEELNENFLRLRAEFSNYKKRIERDQVEFSDYIKGELIKKLLPVMDDLNHMIEKSGDDADENSILEGARLIYQKFHQILIDMGLEKIEAIGSDFDPQFHEAMMMQKTPDKEKHHKVVEVFQEGYRIHNRLIRPSKVVVADFDDSEEKAN
jgi:molecular chaperone GrpE